MQAGAVCVNDALLNYVAVELPMGGWKASGLGTRHGAGRDPQVHQAAVAAHQPPAPQARPVYMFPYQAAVSKLLFRAVRLVYGRGRR